MPAGGPLEGGTKPAFRRGLALALVLIVIAVFVFAYAINIPRI